MGLRTKVFGFSALFSSLVWSQPEELSIELRANSLRTQPAIFEETASLYLPWSDEWSSRAVLRAGQSRRVFENFSYGFESSWHPLSWLAVAGRISQFNQFPDGFGITTLHGRLELGLLRGETFGFSFAVGRYLKWIELGGITLIPGTRAMTSLDQDWGFALKFWARPVDYLRVSTGLSNFEALDVHRLNNPFVELALDYQQETAPQTLGIFSRYAMLLGFGRIDGWLVGLRSSWRL